MNLLKVGGSIQEKKKKKEIKGEKKRGLQLGYMSEANKLTKEPYSKVFKGKIIREYILQLRNILSRKIRLQGGHLSIPKSKAKLLAVKLNQK